MIEKIQQILEKDMGVECGYANLGSKLGETGIGLDSQEIVEFICALENHFKIKLPSGCFTKLSSLKDVISRVQQTTGNLPKKSLFEGKIESSIEMRCSPKEAYLAIYEMDKWPEKLPHVKRIETLYNDGVYQEFLMDVQSDTGMIQVRSIRRCIPEESITFFQPKPPRFLKHHCGGWSFHKTESGCLVKTWHQWNTEPEKAQELFPSQGKTSTQDRIEILLRSHAELALSTWKSILEGVICK